MRKLTSVWRTLSQVVFLAIFAVLALRGRLQVWMLIFVAGVVVSLFWGRFYCSWVCQMGTLLRGIGALKRKLKLPQFMPPAWSKKTWFRWLALALILPGLMLLQRNGLQHVGILALTSLSVLVGLFVHESFWHTAICPYGSLLSLSTRLSRRKVRIDQAACIGCGKCQPVCPTATIDQLEGGKRRIRNADCLNCGQCMAACPVHVIQY